MDRWDLRVNWKKTKVVKVARKNRVCEVRIVDQDWKYLGVIISSDARMEKEVEARFASATRMVGGMSERVLRRRELSKSTKLPMYIHMHCMYMHIRTYMAHL